MIMKSFSIANQSVSLFVRCDTDNNTVTIKQSLEQDTQGTESALAVGQVKR